MQASVGVPNQNRYNVSRLGCKWTVDEQKVLITLPRDFVIERTWAEVLQKEENELVVLEMREEIVEEALRICFERYMERQTAPFTAHCTALAWLKLIDWSFLRHDPGEDPTAYPTCFIPKRLESWIPDDMPDPSPKDSWGRQALNIIEEVTEEGLKKWPSSSSIDVPVVEEIPREYWFPGKVELAEYMMEDESEYETVTYGDTSSDLAAESELLQRVTNYTPGEDASAMGSEQVEEHDSQRGGTTTGTTEVPSTQQGDLSRQRMSAPSTKSRMFTRSQQSRSRGYLPPLHSDSRSRESVISDCRLRSLRLDTQYEISSEKVDSQPKIKAKMKRK